MEPKRINLALQGGGAHGAFTWGVLDRLLEDDRIEIDAITGTSAGAMNATVLAAGMVEGGRKEARRKLIAFWRAVSESSALGPFHRTFFDRLLGKWSLDDNPAFVAFDVLTRFAGPRQYNPLGVNPLRKIAQNLIDFEAVRASDHLKLFVAATNVQTGKVKIFRRNEITLDTLMASACLPELYPAVEIDGVPYWDGGYMGNPPLFPLFYETETPDILLVQINPVFRQKPPRSAREIMSRENEITFNSSLLRELRSVHFVSRLIDEGKLSEDDYLRVRLHRIAADMNLEPLPASSKFLADWSFLRHLFDNGRDAAERWFDNGFEGVGVRDTIDLPAELA